MAKIAEFTSKYSNKSTAAGYKNAIEIFLRCVNSLTKNDTSGKKIEHDYETLFDKYLKDKKRDRNADFIRFSNHLKETRPALSSRQTMTLTKTVLGNFGVKIADGTVRDLKREMNGSAATVEKVLNAKIIDAALKELGVGGRALILCLVSSGAQVNEMLSITDNDIDFSSTPVMITFRPEVTKNRRGRFTFISPEAVSVLKIWIEQHTVYLKSASGRNRALVERGLSKKKSIDDKRIFPMSANTVNVMWENALKASGLFSQDDVTGRNQYRLNSLRKFFITQLSMAGAKTLGEHLSGHNGDLDNSYRSIDVHQAAIEYLKVQDVVTIGTPIGFKDMAKELKDELEIQGESIERLWAINDLLQNQMKTMQQQMQKMSLLVGIMAEKTGTNI